MSHIGAKPQIMFLKAYLLTYVNIGKQGHTYVLIRYQSDLSSGRIIQISNVLLCYF